MKEYDHRSAPYKRRSMEELIDRKREWERKQKKPKEDLEKLFKKPEKK